MSRAYLVALGFTVMTVSAACESLAVTAFGVGASAGVKQAIDGTIYRTFTSPVDDVRVAALEALKHMGIAVKPTTGASGPIYARANGRDIELDFESLSASSTQMRAMAKSESWLYDAATGREIVAQTEKALAAATAQAAAPKATATAQLDATTDAAATAVVQPVLLVAPPTPLSPSE